MARHGGRRDLASDALDRADERIDAERDAHALLQRIRRLPERLRAVVELVAVDGLPIDEAAAVLGITSNTARVRLHRARRRLAQETTSTTNDIVYDGGMP